MWSLKLEPPWLLGAQDLSLCGWRPLAPAVKRVSHSRLRVCRVDGQVEVPSVGPLSLLSHRGSWNLGVWRLFLLAF